MTTDEWIGRQIGSYVIEEPLGRGGMAKVYKARHIHLKRLVALKLMAPELASDPHFIARFKREAELAARLDHPNVVAVYDFGEQGSVLYLTMALVDGGSLQERLDQMGPTPWPPRMALDVLGQVAQALDHAHDLNLVHRDLKPSNILIRRASGSAPERYLLSDFGIARALADSTLYTQTGAGLVGTPTYMSPEQWNDQDLDARSDVYAFSVLAYQLLAGRVPFQGPMHTLMRAHLDTLPPDPRQFNPGLPPALAPVLLRGLAKPREQRPWRAGQVVTELAAATGAPPPFQTERVSLAPPPPANPTPPVSPPAYYTAPPAGTPPQTGGPPPYPTGQPGGTAVTPPPWQTAPPALPPRRKSNTGLIVGLVVGALVLLACLGCGGLLLLSALVGATDTSAKVTDLYPTTATSPAAAGDSRSKVSGFPAGTRALQVAAKVQKLKETTNLEARWYAFGQELTAARSDCRGSDCLGGRLGDGVVLIFVSNQNGFPAGTYRVELYLDGSKAKEVTFNVT